MPRGKAKFVRENGKYKAFVRNHFWQKWRPLYGNNGKRIEVDSFNQISEITKIDCFDEIIMEYHKFSGLER